MWFQKKDFVRTVFGSREIDVNIYTRGFFACCIPNIQFQVLVGQLWECCDTDDCNLGSKVKTILESFSQIYPNPNVEIQKCFFDIKIVLEHAEGVSR